MLSIHTSMVSSLYIELYSHHHKLELHRREIWEISQGKPSGQTPLLSKKNIDLLTYKK